VSNLPFPPRRPAALATALCVALALGACSLDTPVTPVSTLTPAAMALVSGDAQVGAAGNALPRLVIVRVTDPSGAPVSGIVVSFSPAASSGAVNATEVLTDTTGSAGVAWSLGTALGVDSLAVTLAGLPTVTVTATVTAGSPATIAVVSGGAQTAQAGTTLGTPLVVSVTDRFGNAVSGAAVRWDNDSGGIFTSASAVTDASGRAQAVYRLGASPGPEHLTVTVSTEAGAMLTTITETGT
jgi:hypothetical protein